MAEQALLLTKALARSIADDLHRPRCCLLCLHLLAAQLIRDEQILNDVRRSCHEFWDALVAVATAPHTDEQLAAMRQQLFQSVSDCTSSVHRGLPSDYTEGKLDILEIFIAAVYTLLRGCLGATWAKLAGTASKKGLGVKSGLWPVRVDQLTPLGEYQTAEAHVHWCCRLNSVSPMYYLVYALAACRDILFPHLLKSPLRERCIWLLVAMLKADTGKDEFVWPSTLGFPADHPHPWCTSPDADTVSIAGLFLHTIMLGNDAGSGDVYLLVDGYEAALLPALNTALGSNVLSGNRVWLNAPLHELAVELHTKLDLPDEALHPNALRWREEAERTGILTDGDDPDLQLLRNLRRLYGRRGCFAPGCGRGFHESTSGKAFAACAACRFTQYCSRACQKADWRAETAPHRDVCDYLAKLGEAVQAKDVRSFQQAIWDAALGSRAILTRLRQWVKAVDERTGPRHAQG